MSETTEFPNIHVDVRVRPSEAKNKSITYPAVEVCTSVDGAGWTVHYVFMHAIGDHRDKYREDAKSCARIFAHGIEFGRGGSSLRNGSLRCTAFGYSL